MDEFQFIMYFNVCFGFPFSFLFVLKKTLVDVTLENTDIKDQIRNLKHTHEKSMEKLKDKQKQLETAQMENQLLKLQVWYANCPF